jgi:hypothetical protein
MSLVIESSHAASRARAFGAQRHESVSRYPDGFADEPRV